MKKSEKSEKKSVFKHCEVDGKMLLGVPREMDMDEVSVLKDSPMAVFQEGFYKDFFQLGYRDRKIIISSLHSFIESDAKKYKIFPLYWEVLLDFIFCIYEKKMYNIAYDLAYHTDKYLEKKTTTMHSSETKKIYDILDKIKRGKGNPTADNIRQLFYVCCYYKISFDILTTGSGELYIAENEENYTLSNIREYIDTKGGIENIESINLEDMIEEITGKPVKAKVPLQMAVAPVRVNQHIMNYTKKIIENMIKSKDE